jgi:DNA-binding response OmpR family regulator
MVVHNPYRILIVEDHEATRVGLRAVLTNAGYFVLAASTFAEGRRSLAEQAPDLLIADLRLGDYNGLQLVAAASPAVPSIIVTGFPDLVLEAETLKLGARYVTKPIDVAAMLTLIEETIVSARRRQSRGSTRRWDRKTVAEVFAQVEHTQARIVNVSYGGVKFEIDRDQSLPRSFSITVASPALSIDVDLVWENRIGDRHWVCGAAISSANAAAIHDWATLVDGFSAGAEGSS